MDAAPTSLLLLLILLIPILQWILQQERHRSVISGVGEMQLIPIPHIPLIPMRQRDFILFVLPLPMQTDAQARTVIVFSSPDWKLSTQWLPLMLFRQLQESILWFMKIFCLYFLILLQIIWALTVHLPLLQILNWFFNDVLGNTLMSFSEDAAAGKHEIKFDISPLKQGLYFLSLRANGFAVAKRIAVIK